MVTLTKSYGKSEALLERALMTIPLGAQTFSKSRTQFPMGVSPYFIARADRGYAWDVDGNKYIDMINALAAVTLGYNDPDVNRAVQEQLTLGTIFSLSHPIEVEVAEKIVEMVPCAEMVRFGKNGSDATTAAIRLARSFTGRDHVLTCGYHGWHDWYIGSTSRNLGVPKAVQDLTHRFEYNNLEALAALLKDFDGNVAAVIMEPMNSTFPLPGYLEAVKAITQKHGALLVFDETITGFRYANGGAQQCFGVKPDLACFGKGLANGYPLSAIVGRSEVMKMMENIFFSFTFGGEALSLAASLATLRKLQELPVLDEIAKKGQILLTGIQRLIDTCQLQEMMSISGHPSWSFLTFKDSHNYTQWELKTLFLQEIFERGLLFLGTHNLSYAHTDQDITGTLAIYEDVFKILQEVTSNQTLGSKLRCETLVPLFKVR